MKVVLINPMIPQNAGNIARTCYALNFGLCLIKPLGFELSEKHLKRASVQHWSKINVQIFEDWADFLNREQPNSTNLFLFTEHGQSSFYNAGYSDESYLIFGPESADFPRNLIQQYYDRTFYLPMLNQEARCLNVSNVVAVAAYEAMRNFIPVKGSI